jgi:Icc-related predicted phosphoesterase
MKLVLISDLHSGRKTLGDLDKIIRNERPDGILCAGDISNREDSGFFDLFEKKLKSYGLPAFIIWGNNESDDTRKKILNSEFSVHLKKRSFGKDFIYGISDTEDLGDFSPDDIRGSILVTHRPPLRSTLAKQLRNGPRFHLCGHLHVTQGIYKYPATTLIQIPSLLIKKYGVLDTSTGKTEFKTTLR